MQRGDKLSAHLLAPVRELGSPELGGHIHTTEDAVESHFMHPLAYCASVPESLQGTPVAARQGSSKQDRPHAVCSSAEK